MTVAELQLHLSDLSKFLRASQAATAAGELEYISARLAPFKEYKLKAFADFLVKAEEFSRGALAPPKPSRGKKPKTDPAAMDRACEQVRVLYDKSIDPSVTLDHIESAIKALQDLDPPRAKLDELARNMGFAQRFNNKSDVVKAIRQRILGRKGEFDRVHA